MKQYFFAVLFSLLAINSSHADTVNTQWQEIARFKARKDGKLLGLTQQLPITKNNLLNCEFRLFASSPNNESDLVQVMKAISAEVTAGYQATRYYGMIHFIWRTYAEGINVGIASASLSLQEESVYDFQVNGNQAGVLENNFSDNRTTKVLQMNCRD